MNSVTFFKVPRRKRFLKRKNVRSLMIVKTLGCNNSALVSLHMWKFKNSKHTQRPQGTCAHTTYTHLHKHTHTHTSTRTHTHSTGNLYCWTCSLVSPISSWQLISEKIQEGFYTHLRFVCFCILRFLAHMHANTHSSIYIHTHNHTRIIPRYVFICFLGKDSLHSVKPAGLKPM